AYLFMGGQGATLVSDGHSTLTMPDNCSNVPIEVMENRAPVVYEQKEFLPDSGGPGRFRGGLGQRVTARVLADWPILFVPSSLGRIMHPCVGIRGGGTGGRGRLFFPDMGEDLHPRKTVQVAPGTRITVHAPGGGGAGDPFERDPARVSRDVALGFVTPDAARRDYGVACDAAGNVDAAATQALRARQ
ncbi:MAG: hydantoinase B/oxoprolinase family protein, partial [Armatimonadetes bacterium]|nr:hydantoinase B/oxoprolinase family protein [Armatimonadota bacterium]